MFLARKVLYSIYFNRAKRTLYRQTLLKAINALVLTKLYYCSTVWGNTSKGNIKKLQSIQNFAACIITGTKKYDRVTPALKQLRWLPVSEQLRYRDIVLAYKCVKGSAPEYLARKFVRRSHKYQVRCQNTHNPLFPQSNRPTFIFI